MRHLFNVSVYAAFSNGKPFIQTPALILSHAFVHCGHVFIVIFDPSDVVCVFLL